MINQSNFRFVGCVLRDEDDGVLVLHNADSGLWEIPGCEIDSFENVRNVAVNILKDKIGVNAEVIKLLGEYDSEFGHYVWYLMQIKVGEPSLQGAQHDKFGLLPPVTLTRRYTELGASTKALLEAAAYGKLEI